MEETEEMREVQEPVTETVQPPAEDAMASQFEAHIRGLEEQAQKMQQTFPGFDLRQALQNPVFLQLTAPGTGISVEDAYYALHRQEIQQAAAQQTKAKVVSAIQAGSRRPLEAGTTGQAPSITTFQYGSATREQREAFKKELRRAWGRGETVYP